MDKKQPRFKAYKKVIQKMLFPSFSSTLSQILAGHTKRADNNHVCVVVVIMILLLDIGIFCMLN